MPSNPPTMFGLSVRKSWMSRLLRGRSRSCCSSRPRVIDWLSIVMLFCPSAVTDTTSWSSPTSRVRSVRTIDAARSTTPERATFLNPLKVAVTVYVPGRRFGISKSPCSSVRASRVTLVVSSVTTTLAPGTMFCCSSTTAPRMVPSVVCAPVGTAAAKSRITQTTWRRTVDGSLRRARGAPWFSRIVGIVPPETDRLQGLTSGGHGPSILSVLRRVYPLACDHHTLDGPNGRHITVRLPTQDDEICVETCTEASELVAAIQKRCSCCRRRGDRLDRRETTLHQQLQFAPGRLPSSGKRHDGVAAHDDSRALLGRPARELFHLRETGREHRRHIRRLAIVAAFEDRQGGIEKRLSFAKDSVKCLCLRPVEVGSCEQAITSVAPRVVALEYGLSIRFCLNSGNQTDAERRHVLDAMQSGRDELARVEQLQMCRTRNAVRFAHINHGLRACKREPEVDFQRGRSALNQHLCIATRFLAVARDDGVGGVRGVFAVDVRSRREDPRSGNVVRRNHATQLVELLVPLTWIAKRGDAMTELPQRDLRIVLDVKGEIDETRNHRAAGEGDHLGTGGGTDLWSAPDAGDAAAFDDDAAVLDRRGAAAVDDADVVECDAAHLCSLRGRDRQCVRDDGGAKHPSKRSAHVVGLSARNYRGGGASDTREAFRAPTFLANVRVLMMRCFGGSPPAKTASVSFSFIGNVFPASVTTMSFAANTDTRRLGFPMVPSSTQAPRGSIASMTARTRVSRFTVGDRLSRAPSSLDWARDDPELVERSRGLSLHGERPCSLSGRFKETGSAL